MIIQGILCECFIDCVLVNLLPEYFALQTFSEVHDYHIVFTSCNKVFVSFIRHDE